MAGHLRTEDLAACWPRIAQVGFDNAMELMSVLSDNVSMLAKGEPQPGGTRVETIVPVRIPAGKLAAIRPSRLKGLVTKQIIGPELLTVTPPSCGVGAERDEEITVALPTDGLRGDIYEGVLRVCVTGEPETTFEYGIPVADPG